MRIEKSCGQPASLPLGVPFASIPVGGVFRFRNTFPQKVGPFLKMAGAAGYYVDLFSNSFYSASPNDLFAEYQLLLNAHLCTGEEGK